jgi:Domain of unknown function (DUF397)
VSSTQPEPGQLVWRKAQRSMNNGNCIEVAWASEKILVRDSKDPDGSWLVYPSRSWHAFIETVKIK